MPPQPIRRVFKTETQEQKTDAEALAHIAAGSFFHITSGEFAGKYKFYPDTGFIARPSPEVSSGKIIYVAKKTPLPAQALFDALANGQLSLKETATEGKSKPTALTLSLMEEIVNQGGFHIQTGEDAGNYRFATEGNNAFVLKKSKIEVNGGTTCVFDDDATLSAEALLSAMATKNFSLGQDKTLGLTRKEPARQYPGKTRAYIPGRNLGI